MWRYDGSFVTNEKGKIMCVNGNVDGEGRHLDALDK